MTKLRNLIALLVVLIVSIASAEQIRYEDHLSKAGFSLSRSATNGVTVKHSISDFSIDKIEINKESRDAINLPGVFLQNDAGMPNLPGSSRFIAVPQGATVSYKVVSFRTEVIKDVNVGPAPIMPFDTEDVMKYEENSSVYSANVNYPESIVKLSEKKKIRGLDVVMLGITPFQYNPQTKELTVYRDIEVEVSFNGGNGKFGDDRLRDRDWDKVLKNTVMNSSSIKDVEYKVSSKSRTEDFKYIIIVPDDPTFISYANQLKDFRIKQGIRTGVVTMTEVGANTVSAIETYIDNAYNTWDLPPASVLLMADFEDITAQEYPHPYSGTYITDNKYADVDGDDIPDINFARMTAQNEAHLSTMVDKVINYETNPPTRAEFYNTPITALGWQTERWFQICSEAVGGYLSNVEGKDVTRINAVYGGNPNSDPWSTATNSSEVIDYFGPEGRGYITATPGELGGWTGGSAGDVSAAINAGSFMLQHRDHGGETGWGEPGFESSHISNLTNVNNELPFIFSINCLTGMFNTGGECFAETFHRYTYDGQISGALGLIAATQVSYSFVNDTFVWGMFDFMYPNFLPDYGSAPTDNDPFYPSFGMVNGKIFLESSSWPYNSDSKQITYRLFHHHSDAYLSVFSEVPQDLSITAAPIVAGAPIFNVTADAGAIVSLTVEGEIIGVAVGTGSAMSMEIAPQTPANEVLLTVTKQNYFRYEEVVVVTSEDMPYVIFEANDIDDSVLGNNNGVIDFGESIDLSVALKNVGTVASTNITATLSTESDLVSEIPVNIATLSTLNANQIATLATQYEISFVNQIEDQTEVPFILTMNDDFSKQETISTFSLLVNAPNFDYDYTIEPAGTINPGDTIVVEFVVTNNGHADALGLSTELVVSEVLSDISEVTPISTSLDVDEVSSVSYQVIFDESITAGTSTSLTLNLSGDQNLTSSYGFPLTIGVTEDFETGDFTHIDWVQGGNADWIISTDSPYEGVNCAASGDIGNNQTSTLEVEADFQYDNGFISFYSKVSSESGWDFLRFYIDGAQQFEIAGETDWTEYNYDGISAGTHTLKWSFEKDGSVDAGDDCGYLDYLIINTGFFENAIDEDNLPVVTTLYQNYPNPFNPTTAISFFNANAGAVNITVYNAKGQFVQEVLRADMAQGMHKVNFNANGLDSGLYFYTLQADGMTKTRKMILVK